MSSPELLADKLRQEKEAELRQAGKFDAYAKRKAAGQERRRNAIYEQQVRFQGSRKAKRGEGPK